MPFQIGENEGFTNVLLILSARVYCACTIGTNMIVVLQLHARGIHFMIIRIVNIMKSVSNTYTVRLNMKYSLKKLLAALLEDAF